MLIKKKMRREKKRKKEMDLDVFYIRGRRKKERKRRGSFDVKWKILFIKVFYQQFYRRIIKC